MGREAEAERGGGGCGAVEVLGRFGTRRRNNPRSGIRFFRANDRIYRFAISHRSGRLVVLYILTANLFSGKFQPVKWSCRAPLPNGKLCPRMDREKCPFHGTIMARDSMGQPSRPEDRLAEEKRAEEEKQQNPDWQDPNLLKELKAATGVDLKMPIKKGKGMQFQGIVYKSLFMFIIFYAFFVYRQWKEYTEETVPRSKRHPRIRKYCQETFGEKSVQPQFFEKDRLHYEQDRCSETQGQICRSVQLHFLILVKIVYVLQIFPRIVDLYKGWPVSRKMRHARLGPTHHHHHSNISAML